MSDNEPDTAAHDHTVRLKDGRALVLRVYGAPDGLPVVALHGTPGSRLKFSTTDAAAKRLGLRILALDRWGYGGTSPPAMQSLAGFAACRALSTNFTFTFNCLRAQ